MAACFEEWPADSAEPAPPGAADALSPGLELLLRRRIGLMSAAMHLAPGAATRESLRMALNANAEHVRLPGLADDLNPLVLDPARVTAFIEGLPRQPDKLLDRLNSRWLALGAEGLYLSAASPVEADGIAQGYSLTVAEEDASVVQAQMRLALRPAYAQAVAARAQSAFAAFDAEVVALERGGLHCFALTQAKWRRFAAASVWRSAARALAESSWRYRGELRRASDAVGRSVTPPWVGLPPR